MFRSLTMLLCFLLLPSLVHSQQESEDAHALAQIASEIHQLRQELQTVTVLSQRVQIGLYRLHIQESAVDAASQRTQSDHRRLSKIQADERDNAAKIEQDKEAEDHTGDQSEKRYYEAAISQLKGKQESLHQEENDAQSSQAQSDENLRAQQDKLESLQSLLDKLDSSLTALASIQSPQH